MAGNATMVERRRWCSQSGARFPGLPSDTDRVIAAFARLLGSTPRAARQKLRRTDETVRLFCIAAHHEASPHRLARWHALTGPHTPADGLTAEDWSRTGVRDRTEDAARERFHLSPRGVEDLRRYRDELAREVTEKVQLLADVDAEIAARG